MAFAIMNTWQLRLHGERREDEKNEWMEGRKDEEDYLTRKGWGGPCGNSALYKI